MKNEQRENQYEDNKLETSQGIVTKNIVNNVSADFEVPPPDEGYFWFKKKGKSLEYRIKRVQDLNKEIDQHKALIENPEIKGEGEFCGKAFIIFNNQNEATRITDKLFQSHTKRMWRYFFYNIFKCGKKQKDIITFHTVRAAEPTDVFWENLPIMTRVRFWRSVLTFLLMGGLLLISFVWNLALGIFKDKLERHYSTSESDFMIINFMILMILNTANSFIISFFNVSLKHLARSLTEYERHITYTGFTLSLTVKMVTTMYINTAIIPLCVNYQEKVWFARTGLIADIFYNTLAVCFLGPMLYIFDPYYLWKIKKRKREGKKGESSKFTQRQLNELYEGQLISLENRYTTIMLIIMIWATYTVLLPILPIICFFGILFQYFLTKFMLVKRNKRPRAIGHFMDVNASRIFVAAILINGGSIWYFLARLSDGQNLLAWLPIIISGICVILPINYFEKKFRIHIVRKDDNITYDKISKHFQFNYRDWNPSTLDDEIISDSSFSENSFDDSGMSGIKMQKTNKIQKFSLMRMTKYASKDKNEQDKILWSDIAQEIRKELLLRNIHNSQKVSKDKNDSMKPTKSQFAVKHSTQSKINWLNK